MDIEKINNNVMKLFENNKFSGCVLLNDKNRDTIFSFSCGYASREYDVKNTFDTKFNIASIGKPITGVAVTKLIENQKLNVTVK